MLPLACLQHIVSMGTKQVSALTGRGEEAQLVAARGWGQKKEVIARKILPPYYIFLLVPFTKL